MFLQTWSFGNWSLHLQPPSPWENRGTLNPRPSGACKLHWPTARTVGIRLRRSRMGCRVLLTCQFPLPSTLIPTQAVSHRRPGCWVSAAWRWSVLPADMRALRAPGLIAREELHSWALAGPWKLYAPRPKSSGKRDELPETAHRPLSFPFLLSSTQTLAHRSLT